VQFALIAGIVSACERFGLLLSGAASSRPSALVAAKIQPVSRRLPQAIIYEAAN
jgi:hypothetical protein